jgi:hypothetical protein
LQKTKAHRKKVVEKEKKNDLVPSEVTIQSIIENNTPNKQNLHNCLKIMVSEQETVFQSTVYLKSEVQLLCNAYSVTFRKNEPKSKSLDKLIPMIKQCNVIPYLFIFNDGKQSSESTTAVNTTSQRDPNGI